MTLEWARDTRKVLAYFLLFWLRAKHLAIYIRCIHTSLPTIVHGLVIWLTVTLGELRRFFYHICLSCFFFDLESVIHFHRWLDVPFSCLVLQGLHDLGMFTPLHEGFVWLFFFDVWWENSQSWLLFCFVFSECDNKDLSRWSPRWSWNLICKSISAGWYTTFFPREWCVLLV